MVADEGQAAAAAYFLVKGAAEIFHVSDRGFSVVVKLVTAPTILASPEVLVAEPVYRASIRSAGPSVVHRLTRPRFLSALTDAAANLEATIDIALAFTGAARMESSRLAGTDALLATLLLAYADVFGQDGLIGLRRSQGDLADAIGVAERSVNRVVTRWKEEGLLTKRRGRYAIEDPERLAEIAGDLGGCLVHRWREVG
jgi:CRP-like cAMP-binding protein